MKYFITERNQTVIDKVQGVLNSSGIIGIVETVKNTASDILWQSLASSKMPLKEATWLRD